MKEIKLSCGSCAQVDDCDFDWISQWGWYQIKRKLVNSVQFYAARHEKVSGIDKVILMHRQIIGCRNNELADHIDANGLNNQRSNLRIANNHQNCRNKSWHKHSSIFKGVLWNKRNECWYASIKVDYKAIHLGCFDEETDAAIVYNEAALSHFGEFAKLNPIPDGVSFAGSTRTKNYRQ